jgi:hypothetical protein
MTSRVVRSEVNVQSAPTAPEPAPELPDRSREYELRDQAYDTTYQYLNSPNYEIHETPEGFRINTFAPRVSQVREQNPTFTQEQVITEALNQGSVAPVLKANFKHGQERTRNNHPNLEQEINQGQISDISPEYGEFLDGMITYGSPSVTSPSRSVEYSTISKSEDEIKQVLKVVVATHNFNLSMDKIELNLNGSARIILDRNRGELIVPQEILNGDPNNLRQFIENGFTNR